MKLLVSTVLALVLAPSAAAQIATSVVDDAISALRVGETVYVHPAAEATLDDEEAEQLRARIEAAGGQIFVAVLPAEVAAPDAALREIANGVRDRGVYAVVVGRSFRAGNFGGLRKGLVRRIADDALRTGRDEGAVGVLGEFVDRVGGARGRSGTEEPASDSGSDGGGGAGLGIVAAIAAGGVALFALRRRRERNRGRDREFRAVRETAEEDLVALGEDIRALDLDVELPGADPAGKEEYARALSAYEAASAAFGRARAPEDMEAVSSSLEEGRFAMESAKARLAGRRPPDRRQPCFFDPRHGPSVRDVDWAPPGGEPRPVPACAADAIRIEEGEEPQAREVLVGGRSTPYWNAGPAYGPYAGGFFGGVAGGLLPAILVGSLLGGALGFPGAAYGGGPDDAGDGDFDGGDFGGGDIGGGDFGGGDFGGGDFGGGDF